MADEANPATAMPSDELECASSIVFAIARREGMPDTEVVRM